MSLSRRELLKAQAAGIAAMAANVGGAAQAQPVAGGVDALKISWSKAPCRFCGTGCGVMVGIKDGKREKGQDLGPSGRLLRVHPIGARRIRSHRQSPSPSASAITYRLQPDWSLSKELNPRSQVVQPGAPRKVSGTALDCFDLDQS